MAQMDGGESEGSELKEEVKDGTVLPISANSTTTSSGSEKVKHASKNKSNRRNGWRSP